MKKKSTSPKSKKHAAPVPNTGAEPIPPGARGDAFRRDTDDEHAPGSGGGSRHAADDAGSPNEEYGAVDSNVPAAEPEHEPEPEERDGYAGISGGAVGGTPAGGRSRGGRIHRGLTPGEHRGDTTIGSEPSPKSRQ